MPASKVSNHCPERRPVIIAARRTPVARAGSALADLPTERLLAPVIAAVINDARLNPGRIDDVIVGNAAGGGGNIARLALLARIIHRTARNRPRPPNTWARNFIAKNFIKQPIRIVVSDINGLALIAHFS